MPNRQEFYNKLETLFYENNILACIREGERFLEIYSEDVNAHILLASAYFLIANNDTCDTCYETLNNKIFNYLDKVLNLDSNNCDALYNRIDYAIRNQKKLIEIGSNKRHITLNNLNFYLEKANNLIQKSDNKIFAYKLIINLYEAVNDIEYKLVYIERALNYLQNESILNRENIDSIFASLWFNKIETLFNYPNFSVKELNKIVRENIKNFSSLFENQYMFLAEIAFKANDFELSLMILEKLLLVNEGEDYVLSRMLVWYDRFEYLIENGYNNDNAFYYQLLIEKNYFKELELDNKNFFRRSIQILKNDPNSYAANHFAGIYLFEINDFENALTYLDKAIVENAKSVTLNAWILSHFYLNNEIPYIPIIKDLPINIYNLGTEILNLSNNSEQNLKANLLHVCENILTQSHKAFEVYFNENTFTRIPDISYQLWAMNCNNLAIVHNQLKNYNNAILIAQTGLKFAEFWEIHATIIESYIKSEKYNEANLALSNFFENYQQKDIPYIKYLIFITFKAETEYNLKNNPSLLIDIKNTLIQIYNFCKVNPDLNDNDYKDLEAVKSGLQTIKFNYLENLPEQDKIQFYEDIAKNYPNEANPQYMLMQSYMVVGEYNKCIDAAHNYLANKRECLINEYDKVRTYHYLLKAHVLSKQNYDKALAIYTKFDNIIRKELKDCDYIIWLKNVIELHYKLNNYTELNKAIHKFKTIYHNNKWSFDSDLEFVYLIEVQNLYNQNKLIEAKQILNIITNQENTNPLALQYKRKCKNPKLDLPFKL